MLTVRAWVSCGWTSRQIDKKKQQQQQRTNKHISLITLSSLYPKTKSRTGLRYFQFLLLFFTSGQLREIHFKKRNPHRVLRLVCWGVRKPNFKANCMVYIVFYRVVKSTFFFSFCLQSSANNADHQQKHRSVPRCLGRLSAKTYFADNRCPDQTVVK